jgi:hypothetical protein
MVRIDIDSDGSIKFSKATEFVNKIAAPEPLLIEVDPNTHFQILKESELTESDDLPVIGSKAFNSKILLELSQANSWKAPKQASVPNTVL